MPQTAILYPVFVQVALTFILMFWTGYVRVGAVNRRQVRLKDIALGQHAWPDGAMKVSNSFNSQFEMPTLFYTVVILLLVAGRVTGLQIGLAWFFVATRLVHVAIYTGNNNLRYRLTVFATGATAVLAMWIVLALQIMSGSN